MYLFKFHKIFSFSQVFFYYTGHFNSHEMFSCSQFIFTYFHKNFFLNHVFISRFSCFWAHRCRLLSVHLLVYPRISPQIFCFWTGFWIRTGPLRWSENPVKIKELFKKKAKYVLVLFIKKYLDLLRLSSFYGFNFWGTVFATAPTGFYIFLILCPSVTDFFILCKTSSPSATDRTEIVQCACCLRTTDTMLTTRSPEY